MYSFFSQRYREWRSASDLSLKVAHVPGDKMEVDWAGTTIEYIDRFTGEVCTLYLFVATLPYSQYTFVKPIESMDSDSWITCNIAALRFFGGVPRIIVPDNLKTGVDAHTPDEVRVNRTFQEFGEHYGTAIIPTGVRKPKHKVWIKIMGHSAISEAFMSRIKSSSRVIEVKARKDIRMERNELL